MSRYLKTYIAKWVRPLFYMHLFALAILISCILYVIVYFRGVTGAMSLYESGGFIMMISNPALSLALIGIVLSSLCFGVIGIFLIAVKIMQKTMRVRAS